MCEEMKKGEIRILHIYQDAADRGREPISDSFSITMAEIYILDRG